MSATPAYRFTIYAPKSEDAAETTVLAPIAGAAHADPFVVTTIQGVSGAKAYLDFPKGRHGTIDPITKKLTTGNLSLRVFDPRTSTGNSSRWVTAYFGDTAGKLRLIGCKWTLEESTDGGTTWTKTLTGRVHDFSLDDPQWIRFTCWDVTADFTRLIFTGAPHPSITTGFASALLPIGLASSWGTGFQATDPLTGTVTLKSTFTATGETGLSLDVVVTDPWKAMITKVLKDTMQTGRMLVKLTSGTTTCWFWWWGDTGGAIGESAITASSHRRLAKMIGMIALPTTAIPSTLTVGSTVTFQIFAEGAPTEQLPLFIGPVHPIQLFADILDGKYSVASDGRLRAIAPRDSSPGGPWDTTTQWRDLDNVSFKITKPITVNEFVEKQICQPFNLAYRVDGSGNIVPVDLRRSAHVTPVATLTDADLDGATEPTWVPSRDQAVTAANVTYYVDRALTVGEIRGNDDTYPDVPPPLIASTKQNLLVLNDLSTVRDIGEKIITVDAQGLRANAQAVDTDSGQPQATRLTQRLTQLFQDSLGPYAVGVTRIGARCIRTTNALAVTEGAWVALQFSKLPDPASNLRGGTRLALCLSRTQDGEFLAFDFLDAGAEGVAVAPSITNVAAASDESNAIDVTVSPNVAGDSVVVHYATTSTATTARPEERSTLWMQGGTVQGTTVRLRNLPSGMRLWIRARSQVIGAAMKLPSVWVFPSGNGYVDLTGATAPSALAVTNNYANRQDLSWTNGDATKVVEVFRTTGTAPSSWTEAMKIRVLDAGSTTFRATGTAASTQYTYGVRHRDTFGGPSSMATVTVTSGGTAGVAPRPAGVDIGVPASA